LISDDRGSVINGTEVVLFDDENNGFSNPEENDESAGDVNGTLKGSRPMLCGAEEVEEEEEEEGGVED
jgi:hypothetical protein